MVRFMMNKQFQAWVGGVAILIGVSAQAGGAVGETVGERSYELRIKREVASELSQSTQIKTRFIVDENMNEVGIHTVFRMAPSTSGDERSSYLGSIQTEMPGLSLSASKDEILFTHQGRSVSCARLSKKVSPFGMKVMDVIPTGACLVSSKFINIGDLEVEFKAEF